MSAALDLPLPVSITQETQIDLQESVLNWLSAINYLILVCDISITSVFRSSSQHRSLWYFQSAILSLIALLFIQVSAFQREMDHHRRPGGQLISRLKSLFIHVLLEILISVMTVLATMAFVAGCGKMVVPADSS